MHRQGVSGYPLIHTCGMACGDAGNGMMTSEAAERGNAPRPLTHPTTRPKGGLW